MDDGTLSPLHVLTKPATIITFMEGCILDDDRTKAGDPLNGRHLDLFIDQLTSHVVRPCDQLDLIASDECHLTSHTTILHIVSSAQSDYTVTDKKVNNYLPV